MSQPQHLYLILVATEPNMKIPVVCYLVQMDDGTNILIDTGIPELDQLPPPLAPIDHGNVVEQLARLGLEPADIDMLICTHFDMDHTGHHDAFLNAEWIVQQTHYDYAPTAERFLNTRQQWDRPEIQYRFVSGDIELLPGLELILTDGHAPGHQSVLVHLPETGAVLLTIDAAMTQADFEPDAPPHPRHADAQAARTSIQKLLDIIRRENVALVVAGHDFEQWQNVPKLPEFFS